MIMLNKVHCKASEIEKGDYLGASGLTRFDRRVILGKRVVWKIVTRGSGANLKSWNKDDDVIVFRRAR